MDLTQLANLGEFIGGVAVLVTLLYLVVQVRQTTRQLHQNAEVSRGQAELETAMMHMEYYRELLDPEVSDVWERAYADPESLTGPERARFANLMAIWFHMTQGFYRQYRRGLLPEESWEPMARTLAGALRHELLQRWWEHNVYGLAIDFRAYVERLAASYPDEVWQPIRLSDI